MACSVLPVLDGAEGDPEVIAECLLCHAAGGAEGVNGFGHLDMPFSLGEDIVDEVAGSVEYAVDDIVDIGFEVAAEDDGDGCIESFTE